MKNFLLEILALIKLLAIAAVIIAAVVGLYWLEHVRFTL